MIQGGAEHQDNRIRNMWTAVTLMGTAVFILLSVYLELVSDKGFKKRTKLYGYKKSEKCRNS